MKEIEQLYKKVRERHVSTIRRILRGDHSSAEDVLQEAFIKAITYYPTYDEKYGKLENWFARILFNELSKHLRKQKADKCENIDRFKYLEDSIDYLYLIEKNFLIKKSIERIENSLVKQVLEMLYIQGYLIREISETLNISRNRIKRMSKRFKNSLREENG